MKGKGRKNRFMGFFGGVRRWMEVKKIMNERRASRRIERKKSLVVERSGGSG